MHTQKLKGPIAELGLKKKSLLFAELAALAYSEKTEATKEAKKLGFTTVE